MLADLQTRFNIIEAQKEDVLARVAARTEAEQTTRPAPSEWSLREIVQHLVIVEMLMRVAEETKTPPRRKPAAFLVPLLSGAMRWGGVRLPVPPEMRPPADDVPLDALADRWSQSRRALRARLEPLTEETRRTFVALEPVFGPLTAVEVLDLAESHLAYHLRQIARRG